MEFSQTNDEYPKVYGSFDPYTIAMLMEDYAGASGELTAIMTYLFQHSITDNSCFSETMRRIAIEEMTHLELLAEAIRALGGEPRYQADCIPWSSENVNYALPLCAQLKANIAGETTAIENYRQHAAATQNSTVRALLMRIIQDEQRHLDYFERQYACCCQRPWEDCAPPYPPAPPYPCPPKPPYPCPPCPPRPPCSPKPPCPRPPRPPYPYPPKPPCPYPRSPCPYPPKSPCPYPPRPPCPHPKQPRWVDIRTRCEPYDRPDYPS